MHLRPSFLFGTRPSFVGLRSGSALRPVCLRPAPTQTVSPGGRDQVCPRILGVYGPAAQSGNTCETPQAATSQAGPQVTPDIRHQCWEWGIWRPPTPTPFITDHGPSRWPPGAPCCPVMSAWPGCSSQGISGLSLRCSQAILGDTDVFISPAACLCPSRCVLGTGQAALRFWWQRK